MIGANVYHVVALPSLCDLGGRPPLSMEQLLLHLADRASALALAKLFALFDDLVQREAFRVGQIDVVHPNLLEPQQVRGEEPLPAYLTMSGPRAAAGVDDVWEAYFRHAAEVGGRQGCDFLVAWVRFEVALRNALAIERARRLGRETSECVVATDLGDPRDIEADLREQWGAAPTPLAGLEFVTQVRWRWLQEHDAWFTFTDDELAAYAAKLLLLHQWRRVADRKKALLEANTDGRPDAGRAGP